MIYSTPATQPSVRDSKTIGGYTLAPYPLDTCLIHPEKALGDGAVDVVWENRLVRLSRPAHVADFFADPATHIQTLNQAVIAT